MNEFKEIMNSIVSFSEEFYGNLTEEDIEEQRWKFDFWNFTLN